MLPSIWLGPMIKFSMVTPSSRMKTGGPFVSSSQVMPLSNSAMPKSLFAEMRALEARWTVPTLTGTLRTWAEAREAARAASVNEVNCMLEEGWAV